MNLGPVKRPIKKILERWKLEGRARRFPYPSYPLDTEIIFHFSSEGEFEQCLDLIESEISHGKKIVLFFTSPSVARKAMEFADRHSGVSAFIYPLLRENLLFFTQAPVFHHFVQLKKIFIVRYDFFPGLFLLAERRGADLFLLQASYKSLRQKGHFKRFILLRYLHPLLARFTAIYAVNEAEKKFLMGHPLNINQRVISLADFRVKRIEKRLKEAVPFPPLVELMSHFTHAIILGSAWPIDIEKLFSDFKVKGGEKFLALILPHSSKESNFPLFKKALEKSLPSPSGLVYRELLLTDLKCSELMSEVEDKVEGKKEKYFLLLRDRGNLVELYSHFKAAYVGGGLGDGVHSLLEAGLAGAHVFCGPNVARSSEYDYLKEQNYPLTKLAVSAKLVDFWGSLRLN